MVPPFPACQELKRVNCSLGIGLDPSQEMQALHPGLQAERYRKGASRDILALRTSHCNC